MSTFAIPGLMPVCSPKYDETVPPFILYPHCVSDTLWEGIDPIGPILRDDGEGNLTAPPTAAARLLIEFVPRMHPERECVVFDSEPGADGLTEIVNAETWAFSVAAQPLPLDVGWWDWQMKVVDVLDVATVIYKGSILITP